MSQLQFKLAVQVQVCVQPCVVTMLLFAFGKMLDAILYPICRTIMEKVVQKKHDVFLSLYRLNLSTPCAQNPRIGQDFLIREFRKLVAHSTDVSYKLPTHGGLAMRGFWMNDFTRPFTTIIFTVVPLPWLVIFLMLILKVFFVSHIRLPQALSYLGEGLNYVLTFALAG